MKEAEVRQIRIMLQTLKYDINKIESKLQEYED